MHFLPRLCSFIAIVFAIGNSQPAAATGVDGAQVSVTGYCCTAPIPADIASKTVTATVGPGVEFPLGSIVATTAAGIIPISIDVSSTTITADFFENVESAPGSFNGYVLTFSGPGIPAITGVSLDPASTLTFSPSQVALSFTANSVSASIAGLPFTTSTRIILDMEFGPGAGSVPVIKSGGVVSAGAFGAFTSIAPGSWIEIYGSNLAADSRGWSGSDFSGVNAPTSLDGTSVTIGGQPAFIDYINSEQVNAQVPSDVGTGPQPVIVTTANGASAAYTVTVNATQPGLLAPSSFNIGGKQYAGALFSDGATYVLPPGSIAGVPARRAQPGDMITLYGVGFGPVVPDSPAGEVVQQNNTLAASFQLQFGSTQATVTYAGLAPNAVGLYQFDVVVPNIPSSDAVPMTFTLGGAPGTQTLYLPVQNGSVAALVQSLTLSEASATGVGTLQGTVTLSGPAPTGGAVVALSSSSSAASVPATVTVPAGATSVMFTVSTTTVSSNQTATITATYGGGSAQTSLSLTPAVTAAPFSSMILTVNFQPTGAPSGTLSITVTPNAGNATYTASFANGVAFTLLNGTTTNQGGTFTFNTVQPNAKFLPPGSGTFLSVTAASFSFSLTPSAQLGPAYGSVTGMLSVTGSPSSGAAAVTLSGAITGSYIKSLAP